MHQYNINLKNKQAAHNHLGPIGSPLGPCLGPLVPDLNPLGLIGSPLVQILINSAQIWTPLDPIWAHWVQVWAPLAQIWPHWLRFGPIGPSWAQLGPNINYFILFYIISFCFIWLALTFDTKEVTDNLKKSGAFVPGIRPGEQTAAYVDSVLARLTVFGSLYLTLICLLPLALINFAGVSFYLGGTSVLIIVVVLMDFMSQVQSHMMSSQYSSLLKKANLKNYNR